MGTMFIHYYEVRGGHVHISLFGGERGTTLGKWGDIAMRLGEFEDYRKMMIKGTNIEFVEGRKRVSILKILGDKADIVGHKKRITQY